MFCRRTIDPFVILSSPMYERTSGTLLFATISAYRSNGSFIRHMSPVISSDFGKSGGRLARALGGSGRSIFQPKATTSHFIPATVLNSADGFAVASGTVEERIAVMIASAL